MSEQFSPYLEEILREMCGRVRAKYEDINFKGADWFLKHQWSEAEQEDFIRWLTEYFLSNSEARQTIITVL